MSIVPNNRSSGTAATRSRRNTVDDAYRCPGYVARELSGNSFLLPSFFFPRVAPDGLRYTRPGRKTGASAELESLVGVARASASTLRAGQSRVARQSCLRLGEGRRRGIEFQARMGVGSRSQTNIERLAVRRPICAQVGVSDGDIRTRKANGGVGGSLPGRFSNRTAGKPTLNGRRSRTARRDRSPV